MPTLLCPSRGPDRLDSIAVENASRRVGYRRLSAFADTAVDAAAAPVVQVAPVGAVSPAVAVLGAIVAAQHEETAHQDEDQNQRQHGHGHPARVLLGRRRRRRRVAARRRGQERRRRGPRAVAKVVARGRVVHVATARPLAFVVLHVAVGRLRVAVARFAAAWVVALVVRGRSRRGVRRQRMARRRRRVIVGQAPALGQRKPQHHHGDGPRHLTAAALVY